MKAAIFRQAGQPLAVEDVPDPTPGPGEIVVQVGRCGICGTDLHMTSGHGYTYPAGTTPGHEFAGEVVAIGGGVRKLKVGDRVASLPMTGCGACIACQEGTPFFCSQSMRGLPGAFAQYTLATERESVKLPTSLSLADGALVEPLAVGLHGVALAQMAPGARVLVLGAGPIGLATVFWARRLGAGAIAVSAASRRREPLAREMGADAFLDPELAPEQAAQAALGGAPDLVFECAGAPGLIAQAVGAVRSRGTVVVLGCCSVPDTFVPAAGLFKEVRLQFANTYSVAQFEHVARTLDAGHLEPRAMVTDTVGLQALPATFEALRERTAQCKVLLDPWR
ncbi:alcohol dehydrogenase [Pseudomonas nicosulfuronedens]|uniref:Alcohol dehydrogenase n=1 Tax=Pseudomonas nicosulfuronedens TaxID=2571105 RepID=A0A5R9QMN7_9PSED|nr:MULTISPECIES: alcohol dehydrogenase catalytic domain-containing protein [Pseudomonas]TLX70627.1 alcohol dehydrogenase [Pseudomonas nicosulfuronedens]